VRHEDFNCSTPSENVSRRLGVGAPVPKAASLSREVARLKGHLSEKNNKRTRDEEGARTIEQESGSDDEESRATAIKKKVKTDPFGGNGKVKPPRIERKPSENKISTIQNGHTPSEESPLTEVLRMTKDSTPVPTTTARPKSTSESHTTTTRGDHGYTNTVDAPPMAFEQPDGELFSFLILRFSSFLSLAICVSR